MQKKIDARGLVSADPVFLMQNAFNDSQVDVVEILLDDLAAREMILCFVKKSGGSIKKSITSKNNTITIIAGKCKK